MKRIILLLFSTFFLFFSNPINAINLKLYCSQDVRELLHEDKVISMKQNWIITITDDFIHLNLTNESLKRDFDLEDEYKFYASNLKTYEDFSTFGTMVSIDRTDGSGKITSIMGKEYAQRAPISCTNEAPKKLF